MIAKSGLARLFLATMAVANATAGRAGSDDGAITDDEKSVPALIELRDGVCSEDYGTELRQAGLSALRVSRYSSLRDLARFVGLLEGLIPQHLLIARGYVFADHVAPAKVIDLLRSKPDISGLIGPADCPNAVNHEAIHRAIPRTFDSR